MTAVTDTTMTSTTSPHTARRIRPARYQGDPERWRVTWLPEQLLTRSEATTAMLLAEQLAGRTLRLDDPRWIHFERWATELHLTGQRAAELIAEQPHTLDRRFHTMTLSCWCEPATALDGHREADGTDPVFAATDQDPVDADGFLLDGLAR